MSVYVLAQLQIHDRGRYQRYVERFAATLFPFAGRVLAADEAVEVLEGNHTFDKLVLIEFRDAAEVEKWAGSAAYREIAVDRKAAATGPVVLIRGVEAGGERTESRSSPDFEDLHPAGSVDASR